MRRELKVKKINKERSIQGSFSSCPDEEGTERERRAKRAKAMAMFQQLSR